jgi:glycosyltransferase involved in cell wall biosynthesis
MTRALWISHFPVFGGPHNLALQLREPLLRLGAETTMLLPAEQGTAAMRLRAGGVPMVTIPLRRVRRSRDPRVHLSLVAGLPREVRNIRQVLREGEHDLVLLTGLANPHGAIAARLEGLPIVWQILDTATPRAVRAAVMPLVRRLADAVMFNGRTLVELHSGCRPLKQPTVLFTGPADTERFSPVTPDERAAMRAELGVPPDVPFVGTVANLNPMKGIEWFIRAAERVHQARPDTWFLISGACYDTHRGYLDQLEREMRSAAVPAERWIVRHEPPDRHYPALDVKLITSLPASEGRTTTAPEAMACGLPVVATDVGAVREVVEHETTGLVVPPLDPEALATATVRLLADPALRGELGRVARERAVARYSLLPSATVYIDCYADARSYHEGRAAGSRFSPTAARSRLVVSSQRWRVPLMTIIKSAAELAHSAAARLARRA